MRQKFTLLRISLLLILSTLTFTSASATIGSHWPDLPWLNDQVVGQPAEGIFAAACIASSDPIHGFSIQGFIYRACPNETTWNNVYFNWDGVPSPNTGVMARIWTSRPGGNGAALTYEKIFKKNCQTVGFYYQAVTVPVQPCPNGQTPSVSQRSDGPETTTAQCNTLLSTGCSSGYSFEGTSCTCIPNTGVTPPTAPTFPDDHPICTNTGPPPNVCDSYGCHPDSGNYYWSQTACQWVHVNSSPIIYDSEGDGYQLTDAAHGVDFLTPGHQHGWVAPGSDDKILAFPGKNGNETVDGPNEVFGDRTDGQDDEDRNGFSAAATYDNPASGGNGDGKLDSNDWVWPHLRWWGDVNGDGIQQPNELTRMDEEGVVAIYLRYKDSDEADQYGNRFEKIGKIAVTVEKQNRIRTRKVKVADVFFVSE